MIQHLEAPVAAQRRRLRGLAGFATAATLLLVIWLPSTALGEPEQVTLCHAAGQVDTEQWVTLTISYQAAFGQAGHFNEDGTPQAGHEADYLGPCVTDETTTTAAPASTTTAPTSTTTTQAPTTTTPASTSTTQASTTTTTQASTTTTADSTTTTDVIAFDTSTLPLTGVESGSAATLALSLIAAGTVAVLFGRSPVRD